MDAAMGRIPVVFAAAFALVAFSDVALAQQKSAAPPPPAVAPPKPYKPVALTLPTNVSDESFEAFRKDVTAIAQRKDRAALAKLVVAKGFFWERDDGKPAPKRSSMDILVQALDLGAKDGSGWLALLGFVAEPTASPLPERKDVLCAPATPDYDERELEELAQMTETDTFEWGYPVRPDVEVRETPSNTAPAIAKLGLHFVRVLDDDSQSSANTAGEWLRVVVPKGEIGFVAADTLASLTGAQLCYQKDGAGWKIAGVIGGGG
jgi:hypothetical protein